MNIFKTKFGVLLVTLLLIIYSAGAGWWLWNTYGPSFEELKNKDPEQFSLIVAEIKNLNLIRAGNLAIELNRLTPNQVRLNRYKRLKQNILTDDNFRQEVKAVRKGEVERARVKQNKNHAVQIRDAELQTTSNVWNEMEPWKKGLVLRETCQEILSKNRKLPVDYCDQAIPIGQDEHYVTRALENLKLDLDYFDFSRLLNQAGIPSENAISHSGKLLKMTGSLGGA
ncbi:MAG: hypothetical protein ACQ9MH_14405 [Nitrospinales bacterium]